MSPRISIIIPVLNEAAYVGRLLASLDNEQDIEIIVVDGGSTDDTLTELKRFPLLKIVNSSLGRGIQLNQGAKIATGEILWFLHADSIIPANWREAIEEILAEPGVAAGSFSLKFSEEHRMLKVFAAFSRLNYPLLTYGDQGYFMRRAIFDKVGGFEDYPILEDVEIQCRLRKVGRWKKSKSSLVTSARRFIAKGIIRQQLKNIGIVSLFLAGASPFWLSRFYLPESTDQANPVAQSTSRKPTALIVFESKKGRFTKLPLSVKS